MSIIERNFPSIIKCDSTVILEIKRVESSICRKIKFHRAIFANSCKH